LIRGTIAVLGMVGVFLLVMHRVALPQQNFPNCTEFGGRIPHQCCCTNDCCSEAGAGEFAHVRDELYRSTVTGQHIYRTGWSADGRTVKCACDQDSSGRWVKHPKANVRCLFMPMPSS
jgi:hypothetical protein